MKQLSCATALACCVVLVACGSKRDATQVEKPAAVVAAPGPAPAPAESVQAPTAPAIEESDVRALVEHWTAAQNAGDFTAYEALYAQRFQGIKRVATRTYRFDREGWMRDRKRMFAPAMKVAVAVSDVAVMIGTHSALARFEQDWSSKSFHDHGPKQLVLVPERGGLRIANEQMIASAVETPPEQEWSLLDFMQVVHARHDYVVLSRDAEAWAIGRPALDSGGQEGDSAREMADVKSLPQAVRDLLGQAVVAYSATGEVCRAKVGKPFAWRRVIRQFSAEDREQVERDSPEKQAHDIWEEASELTLLVAKLIDADKSCTDALWARAAERPAPVVFAYEDAAPALVRRVETQVRRLPHYREIDGEYRSYLKQSGDPAKGQRWENYDDARPNISVWRGDGRQLVSYDVDVGGCGNFGGALWALFELRGDALVLLAQSGSGGVPDDFRFQGVIDIDLDALPDVLGANWKSVHGEADEVTRGTREGLQLLQDVAPPFHGCGC